MEPDAARRVGREPHGGSDDPDLLDAGGRDVAIRDPRTFHGPDSPVRVAVCLPEENDRLLEALDG